MRVSTRFPIAVHILMMVAYFPEKRITSEVISQSVGCNAVIVRNLFLQLKQAGLLSAKAGRSKLELAKPAQEITLWDIYSAVETDKTEDIFKFSKNTSEVCPVGSHLKEILTGHLDEAVLAMKEQLSQTTLEVLKNEIREAFNNPCAGT
jgi:DNA-binding IscR family transcriptional regulator